MTGKQEKSRDERMQQAVRRRFDADAEILRLEGEMKHLRIKLKAARKAREQAIQDITDIAIEGTGWERRQA